MGTRRSVICQLHVMQMALHTGEVAVAFSPLVLQAATAGEAVPAAD